MNSNLIRYMDLSEILNDIWKVMSEVGGQCSVERYLCSVEISSMG